MTHKLISSDEIINIPPDVAVCPYCGGKLSARFESWDQEDDGSWSGGDIDLECETIPESGLEAMRIWNASHSEMPYVYWMPVEEKVKTWINERYRFDLHPVATLEAWTEAVKDWQR